MPSMGTMLSKSLKSPSVGKKSELGARIQWIGWLINFRAGTISIPQQKLDKLSDYLKEMIKSSKTNRKALEKLTGLLMWLTQIFPLMRIWIHYLYQDLYTIPATHFSVDAVDWPRLDTHLSDDLTFMSRPPQSAIPIGSTLFTVRHQPVTTKQDLQHLRISTDKRIWLRLRDPGSSRRTIREDSFRVLKLFQSWVSTLVPTRSLCPKPFWSGYAAADACASGDTTQIGGFIQSASGRNSGLLRNLPTLISSSFHFQLTQPCRRVSLPSKRSPRFDWFGLLHHFFQVSGFPFA